MTKQRFSWMNPKLEIRKTGRYGKGVYARQGIKKGETLFVMGGYILTIDDDNKAKDIVADKAIEISDIFFVGPRKPSDLARMPQHYVNHSCNPNTGFKGQIFMVAMRSVRGGGGD
ncbi:MAG: SET domain-containing protein [Deltaproteobacteria bacterium]